MYGRKVKLRFLFVVIILITLILTTFLILKSLEENVVYFQSPSEIKSLTEIFATTSNIATKDNFITIGEGVNATTQLRFVGGDARDLAGQQIGLLVAGMVDNHDKGNVPQETYDALNISSITSKNNLIANAGAYTNNFVITDFKNEINVTYSGAVPNLFAEGKGVVAEGFLKDRNFFSATKILAKHDENYMPPEVKEALGEK